MLKLKPSLLRLGVTMGLLTALLEFTATTAVPAPARGEEQRAQRGMVVSAEQLASSVGVQVLKEGGNAVDAAVAAGFALAVTYPLAGNLGGGGFMLVRMADGQTAVIDFRETAPARATAQMYQDRAGKVIPDASTIGPGAVAVPGTVAGLGLAHARYGTSPWRKVVQPARMLAAKGYRLTSTAAADLRDAAHLDRFPESRRVFRRNGRFYRAGELFRQPELAATLDRIEKKGPRDFYEGATAKLIYNYMRANRGRITLADLKRYRPVIRKPLIGTYRNHEIITTPPPSSGGIALLEMLNMLEGYNLAGMTAHSPQECHLLVEVMRRAFADRSVYGGDPAFLKIPVPTLLSKEYAAETAKSINLQRATPSAEVKPGAVGRYESKETTHLSVVDAAGNVVSMTYTLNGPYGSGATIPGAGLLLNNEMDDFTVKAGVPNLYGLVQGKGNAIQAGKRPLSSMMPTVVLKDGKPLLALGSPGGPTIITSILTVLVNVVDHKMTLEKAVDAPRIHHQWLPDSVSYEPNPLTRAVLPELRRRGHHVDTEGEEMGEVQAIMIDPATGDRIGVSDRRSPDGAAWGY